MILDVSGSMSLSGRFELMQKAAIAVLGTLTNSDW